LLLTAAAAQIFTFTRFELLQIHTPFSLNFGEGHLVWMAMQITNAHAAYQPVDHIPFIVYPYMPLYMLVVRLLNSGNLLMTGRWITLGSTLALTGIVGGTVLASTPKAPMQWKLAGAAASVGLLLTMNSVIVCAPLMRIDMLALLFSIAGFATFILLGRQQAGSYAGPMFFVLAVFTKQVCIAAPIACLSVGLLANWRQTFRAYGAAVVLGLAGLAGGSLFYGRLFLSHTITYNVAPYNLRNGLSRPLFHLIAGLPFVIIAMASAITILIRAAHSGEGWLAWLRMRMQASLFDRAVISGCAYFAMSTALLPLIGKWGADVNYFLDWDIASAFLAGLFVFKMMNGRRGEGVWKRLLLASLLVPAVFVFVLIDLYPAILTTVRTNAEAQSIPAAQAARVVEMIRETPGTVFSEDMLLSLMGGKPPIIEMASVNYMRMKGRWDDRPLVEMIDQRRFGLIVSYGIDNIDRYSPDMTVAISRNYILSEHLGEYYLFRPAPRQ
jgi:hypothetical protein